VAFKRGGDMPSTRIVLEPARKRTRRRGKRRRISNTPDTLDSNS